MLQWLEDMVEILYLGMGIRRVLLILSFWQGGGCLKIREMLEKFLSFLALILLVDFVLFSLKVGVIFFICEFFYFIKNRYFKVFC